MRFYVECAFPHLRKRRPTSRKSAFCPRRLTERRILPPTAHGKAHSACAPYQKTHSEAHRLGRVHLSVRSNSKPRFADPRASRPAAWRGGCPTPPGLPRRDGKAHSAPDASRKSAVWRPPRLTERRSLACLGITHRAFPRLLKPQNVSFRNSRLDCRRHDDAPRPPLDVVSTLTRRGEDAWCGVARGQGVARINGGLTESCPILRK